MKISSFFLQHSRSVLFVSLYFGFFIGIYAQEAVSYQKPPAEIEALIDAPLPPAVSVDSKGENIIYYYRDRLKSIKELSEPELRLAGLRINPKVHIGSRTSYYNKIALGTVKNPAPQTVSGLPQNARMTNFKYDKDRKYLTFTHTSDTGVSLWVIDIEKAEAKPLTGDILNANLGFSYIWMPDGAHLLIKTLAENEKSSLHNSDEVPAGPTVSVSGGKKAQNRTYQDLLKNPQDEENFEALVCAAIKKVSLNGEITDFLPENLYKSLSFSPDGNYFLVSTISRPFSYIVPYNRFPTQQTVYNIQADQVAQVNDVPLLEVLPQGFNAAREGRRNLGWRADQPATLFWVEALDQGDPQTEVDFRDAVYQLEAPFTGEKQLLVKTINRFAGLTWGNAEYAVVMDSWFENRNTKTYVFNPSRPEADPFVISDRSYQDYYADPGRFVTTQNKYQKTVLALDKNKAFLNGAGYTEKGQFPFIDQVDLKSGKTKRLYQSAYTDKKETLSRVIDIKKGTLLVRIESKNEYPDYYIRNINKKALTPLTHFENPFKILTDVYTETIRYKRADGLDLEGTLYLPAGYDFDKKEKLPMLLWAYPREYKDKNTASQSTASPNAFISPNYGSPVFWVTQGYAVLDRAAFPIVGEADEEPNDTFVEQLVANAKAAIDALDERGYIDRNRVAVGGHSYGAFMTANLLTHSDLFAAGIARSGAYNRTLTPFGFQSERRNYWEAPEIYNQMSPFMHVDKIKAPILLIHGEADNNSGTFPIQSERYFNALKGFGATAKLVFLPKESHGYAAKENILHMLYEQNQWLEKYVKNKK